jgi:hypothetical protein
VPLFLNLQAHERRRYRLLIFKKCFLAQARPEAIFEVIFESIGLTAVCKREIDLQIPTDELFRMHRLVGNALFQTLLKVSGAANVAPIGK